MKILYKFILIVSCLFMVLACNEMDLTSLDKPNSESWYSTKEEFRYSLNSLYSASFYRSNSDMWTDDLHTRDQLDYVLSGNLDAEWGTGSNIWFALYQGVSRANTIIEEIERKGDVLGENLKRQYLGEAYVAKASIYAYLVAHYGDVPYFDEFPGIEESYSIPRTDKDEIKIKMYNLFDLAGQLLPESYTDIVYATKGFAYAYKARSALWLGDYDIAAEAAKACIDLNIYDLHPDFGDLFYANTRKSKEIILSFPRSETYNNRFGVNWWMPRSFSGGYAGYSPSWQLLASFNCRDGLPIDESPLFDPHNPFMDRDPRLLETIIPFGKLTADDDKTFASGFPNMGIEYNPYPLVTYLVLANGDTVLNKDTRSTQAYASFNGLLRRKGIDETWADDMIADPNNIVIRYAEVLLTYAEAKIELNQIDESVLNAINAVRERAYRGSEFNYPEVTTTEQSALRKIVRTERRSEFAFEGLRYMDLIRWKIAEKALVGNTYGLSTTVPVGMYDSPTGDLIDNVVTPGNWFWGLTPEIDEDGIADFTPLYDQELCRILFVKNWDASKQYLFPIPYDDIRLNEKLTQNPGY